MIKLKKDPACYDCLVWDEGVTAFCTPNTCGSLYGGEITDPIGLNLQVNFKLPNGCQSSLTLSFETKKDVDILTKLLTKEIEKYNKRDYKKEMLSGK